MSLSHITTFVFLLSLPISVMAAGAAQTRPNTSVLHREHSKKNSDVARLAGVALHLSQDVQALARSSVKRREKLYGRSDPQAQAGRRRLRRIHRKVTYFQRVKRGSEGRERL